MYSGIHGIFPCTHYFHNCHRYHIPPHKSSSIRQVYTCTLHPTPHPPPPPHPPGLFFLVRPETAYAPLGTNTSFTCSGTSSTSFFIFWRRNGILFSTNELASDGISYENSVNGNVVSSELTVPTSVENIGTSFTCLLIIPTVDSNVSNPVQLIILSESVVRDCACMRVCGCVLGGVGVSTHACVS